MLRKEPTRRRRGGSRTALFRKVNVEADLTSEGAGHKGRILVVEDDAANRRAMVRVLESEGFDVAAADSGEEALKLVGEGTDVVLCDLKMPGMDGMAVLEGVHERFPRLPFVMVTAFGTIDTAVEAMKLGAADYITKPINPDEMILQLEKLVKHRRMARRIDELQSALDEKYGLENIVGSSEPMVRVFRMIRQVAPVTSTVLITGESGTGKELVARAIHRLSPRKDAPFVAVDCAALPATLVENELFGHARGAYTGAHARQVGYFAVASGGTLFIDEIGDFDLNLQGKLLRALEQKEFTPIGESRPVKVDVRLIAATNRDLETLAREGRFRSDLYYRLNVIHIELPPLRHRKEDIPLLAAHFLKELARQANRPTPTISPRALDALVAYDWQGNVRQLRNVLESVFVLSEAPRVELADLPRDISRIEESSPAATPSAGLTMEDLEKQAIVDALSRHNGNRTQAAKALAISVRTLHRKLKKFGLGEG